MIQAPLASESAAAVELRDRDLICFSHDWNGDPLSKTHLMRLLARRNRVLWVNSIGYRTPTVSGSDIRRVFKKLYAARQPVKEVEPNLFVLHPLAIPLHGRAWAQNFNRRWLGHQVRRAMRRLQFSRPINWVFNPAAACIAGTLGEEAIVYYCVDEYTALAGVKAGALAELEQQLLNKANLVIVSSEQLYRDKAPANPATVLVRHGVDFDHFRRALDPQTTIPDEIAHLPRPIIGYFGLISPDWVDMDLLVHVAQSFPNASLVMLGKQAMDLSPLRRFANVHLLGRKPYETLPNFCKGFDAAIIPFPVTRATLSANPLKAREYLAAGLPVVSTPIPEVRVLSQCRIGFCPDTFVEELRAALKDPGPKAQRSESMRGHGWQSRLAEVERAFFCRNPSFAPSPIRTAA